LVAIYQANYIDCVVSFPDHVGHADYMFSLIPRQYRTRLTTCAHHHHGITVTMATYPSTKTFE